MPTALYAAKRRRLAKNELTFRHIKFYFARWEQQSNIKHREKNIEIEKDRDRQTE